MTDVLTTEDRAMSAAHAAYRAASLPRDGDEPEECMWAAVHATRDVYEAELEQLQGARLRDHARWREISGGLEAEVERLREELERIASLKPMPALDPHDTQARCRRLAREALNA